MPHFIDSQTHPRNILIVLSEFLLHRREQLIKIADFGK